MIYNFREFGSADSNCFSSILEHISCSLRERSWIECISGTDETRELPSPMKGSRCAEKRSGIYSPACTVLVYLKSDCRLERTISWEK